MSAVDDVDARLCRLEEALQLTQTQLLELSTQRAYNPTRGVDEDRGGRSVATLEITVLAARNLVFQSGFLAGKRAYVRAALDPPGAALDPELLKCTQKRAVAATPCWQETVVFHGMTQLHSRLVVEVVQEERLGADRAVGAVAIDVSSLHDQRPTERWHALTARDGAPTHGQLFLSCRLHRSAIFALELESELLHNQIRELRDFVDRQRHFSLSLAGPPSCSSHVPPRTASGRSLDGKEVRFAAMATPARTPPRRLHAEALHSPVVAVRKRERRLSSAGANGLASPTGSAASATGLDVQQPRIKRRKLEPVTETHVDSLSVRLANWLLPTASISWAAPTSANGNPGTEASSSTAQSPIRRRPHARASAAAHKKKKKASALAALEHWLFQDAASPPPSVDLIHAQMRAES